ncbi:MAG: hypothetical protein ACK52C_13000 [Planctomycetia bacterium]
MLIWSLFSVAPFRSRGSLREIVVSVGCTFAYRARGAVGMNARNMKAGTSWFATWAAVVIAVVVGPLATPARTEVIGSWDFSSPTPLIAASGIAGMSLNYLPTTPYYTPFGGTANPPALDYRTTSSFGITPLAGHAGNVMKMPNMSGRGAATGLMATFTVRANGTNNGSPAAKLNRYSVVMDVLVPGTSFVGPKNHINLFQPRASADGSLFLREPSRNIGGAIYSGTGTFQPDTWYRLALVMNLDAASNVPRYESFLNGQKVGEIIWDQIVIDDTRTDDLRNRDLIVDGAWSVGSASDTHPSLSPSLSAFFLFNDNDNEVGELYVANLQFRDSAMTQAEVAQLGSATGGIIAVPEPASIVIAGSALLCLGGASLWRQRTASRRQGRRNRACG